MGNPNESIRWSALGVVAIELALAATVMVCFQFDLARPLGWDFLWVVPVFLAHAVMPLRWRRPFLLAVTVGLLWRVLGLTAGIYVVAVGLLLIGLCHLPIAFRWRVLLVLVVAAILALVQGRIIDGGKYLEAAIPILGGIFMFRLILYLYEIRHEKPGEATPLERLGYFFLLPSPLAPFFPALDYEVYLRSYYQRPAFETYQTGMLWISRGVFQLALYRVVYHFFSPSPEEVRDLASFAEFCVAGYLIYLRVSGLFHIISGGLRLFGYALPETHHLYFFAHNFSDYWRRINIYWKDFMMKIVFYPVYMRLRRARLGHLGKLTIATIVVFFATAVLHAYQTFWLRGDFTIHETDYAFWGLLGGFVILNNFWDARRGASKPKREEGEASFDVGHALSLSMKALGMFLLFAVLWAMWSCHQWEAFWDVMRQARNAPPSQVFWLVGIAVTVVVLGVAGQGLAHRGIHLFESHPGVKRSILTTLVPLLILAGLWQYHSSIGLPGWLGRHFEVIWIDQLNERDRVSKERSYYEGLLSGARSSVGAEEEAMVKKVVPDVRALLYRESFGPQSVWGATWTTNRWGMRDQFYSKVRTPGVFRMAISGASYVSGRGVGDGETFESLVEKRFNEEGVDLEILNFGTSASCTIQRLADLELRILDFHPDAFLLVCHGEEVDRNLRTLARIGAERGSAGLTFPFLQELFERAGISEGDTQAEIKRALAPYREELMRWTYGRIAELCAERGIRPVWVYLANTRTRGLLGAEEGRRFAEEAGLSTIILDGAYGGLPWQDVALNEADTHPNQLGHEMIAKRLYEKIREHREEVGLPPAAVPDP